MITASKLAGFLAAHAIWSVSDGATLIPILGYTTADGKRNMHRLAGDDLGAAVALGKRDLESNAFGADDAVLLYDARIPIGGEKVDAIVIEMRAYFSLDSRVVMAVPYTPAAVSGTFRVHKPKLLAWERCEDFDMNTALGAFFDGVAEHEKGAKVWNDHLDESK
jgi:hypothetical protein